MNRLSQSFKIGLAFLFAVLSTNLLPVYASALTAPTAATDTVDICHANEGKKGYTSNSENVSSINNLTDGNGHGTDNGTHGGDIIPPFTNTVGDTYAGKNWTTANQTIYKNDCKVVEDDPVPAVISLPTGIMDICGRANDTVPYVSTDTYTVVSDSGWVKDGDDATKTIRTISYKAKQGTKFEENAAWILSADRTVATYTFTDWGTVCEEPPVRLVQCESFPLIHATNTNQNGWTLVKGAAFVEGGIKLSSPGDWVSSKISRTMSGSLADLGAGVDYTPDTLYLGLHVQTAEGTLVYETAYGGNWWLGEGSASANMKSNAPHTGGGQGSNYYGTLQEWATAFPELQVQKLTVLYTSPTPASTTVTSVKIGCNEYTFDYERLVQACTVRDNTYRDTWMFDGFTYPEADDYSGVVNNATFQFTNEGLHISTPDKPSYVFGLIDGGKTPLADVDAMSYKTFRKDMSAGYEQTLPAYILYVDTNGDAPNGETYFFYEPYNNGEVVEGTWQTWDAINSGNAKWWMSGTGQKLQTWSYFVGQFPDAVVLAYGFNQGTSNAETYAIIQDMEFDCATTSFAAPQVLGEETTNPTPTGPTVIVPTTGTVLPAQIPATGGDNSNQIAMLVAIIVGGLTYFLVLRRQESYDQ